MQKGGCICITITILTVIIGITILVLYFTLGSGDNGGNNVNIDDNGRKGENGNNIIQKTSQGGIHFFECEGQLHVNWQALMAMGMVIVAILTIKWGIQYNWCRIFKACKKNESESHDKVRDNSKKKQKWEDIEMAPRGHLMGQTDSSNDRIAKTHNLTNKHSEKLTVSTRQTESDEHVMERRVVSCWS